MNMTTNITNDMRAAPALSQIGDVDKLYGLARERSPESRVELSRVIGSILEANVSVQESEMVADILIKLMRQAEKDLRKVVAEQISTADNAPLRLVLQLANDDIEIAKPVLSKSNVLSDFDLMYIVRLKTTEYWQAIATREDLGAQVIDILADTDDFDTALTLVKNENIELTDHALLALSDMAQGSEMMAVPLLRREEVSSDIAASLYQYVGAEIKNFISQNYDLDMQEAVKIVDNAVEEFATSKALNGLNAFMPEPYMITAAQKFKEKNMLNMSLMLSTLRLGHIRSFIAQFAAYTDISVDCVCNVLSQANGAGLAIVSKNSGIKKQDFISIFMLSSKIWNHGRLVEMGEVQAAIAYYNNASSDIIDKITSL